MTGCTGSESDVGDADAVLKAVMRWGHNDYSIAFGSKFPEDRRGHNPTCPARVAMTEKEERVLTMMFTVLKIPSPRSDLIE